MSPIFPLTHFRATCLKSLGFDGFFQDLFDNNTLAFLLPKSCYESGEYVEYMPLIPYFQDLLEIYGWKCESVEHYTTNTYETDRCGSRFRTQTLGPHILFRIVKEREIEVTNPLPYIQPPIHVPKWIVDTVSYDTLKPESSRIAYNIHLHEAAFPTDYMDVHNALVKKARAAIEAFQADH